MEWGWMELGVNMFVCERVLVEDNLHPEDPFLLSKHSSQERRP